MVIRSLKKMSSTLVNFFYVIEFFYITHRKLLFLNKFGLYVPKEMWYMEVNGAKCATILLASSLFFMSSLVASLTNHADKLMNRA